MVKIEDLIDNSDLTILNKNLLFNFVSRAKEQEEERRKVRYLIEEICRVRKLEEVVLATEELIIYKIKVKDEWDAKYAFRGIYFKENNWHRIHTFCTSVDEVLLTYLGEQYLGNNNQFANFALKMLEIKIEE